MKRLGRIKRYLCALRQHGPFFVTTISTADRGLPPLIVCERCAADCSSLFIITKGEGRISIISRRFFTSTMIHGHENSVIARPMRAVTYEAGHFILRANSQ